MRGNTEVMNVQWGMSIVLYDNNVVKVSSRQQQERQIQQKKIFWEMFKLSNCFIVALTTPIIMSNNREQLRFR
jgi:hypothetical protein